MIDQLGQRLATGGRRFTVRGIDNLVAQVIVDQSLQLDIAAGVEFDVSQFLDGSDLLLQLFVISLDSGLELSVMKILDDMGCLQKVGVLGDNAFQYGLGLLHFHWINGHTHQFNLQKNLDRWFEHGQIDVQLVILNHLGHVRFQHIPGAQAVHQVVTQQLW